MNASLASLPLPLRSRRASGSVVLAWVAFERRSPRKSTVGLPGSSTGSEGAASSLGRKLLRLAAASISVPSTVKCASLSKPNRSAASTTSSKNRWATSCRSSRRRFLAKVLAGVEARLDHVHAQEPAVQEVVLQLLAE